MRILIKGGRVLDPGRLDGKMDVYVQKGVIEAIAGEGPSAPPFAESEADRVINAAGCLVTPGLIDMHVHLREPGEEYKESIATGIRAAAAGGFTSICCMPNTRPANDCPEVTTFIGSQAGRENSVRVFPVGAISRGLEGRQLCEYGELKKAGAIAVSDDGRPVIDSQLMRRALEYAGSIGLQVISHCEELPLARGVMNEGSCATRLGLSGIPNAAETVMVMRDIALAELTGVAVHIAHVSTSESVREIRAAKERGVRVSAETGPHYFTLTDESVGQYNTHAKMNPPLRGQGDRRAVREALADGTIDAVATDHAPHSVLEKQVPFDEAANGIIGLETSLALGLSLVEQGGLTLSQLIDKMSLAPARILGLPAGLQTGAAADITVIDPCRRFSYDAASGFSKSRNTPFDAWELPGRATHTIVGGKIVHEL
ncbi:MAG: dihydroorotase [Desulfosalsimonadaceae bacterium]